MSLYEAQKQVDDWAKQFNPPYWPPLEQLARLMEETGELARELNHKYELRKRSQMRPQEILDKN